MTRFNTGNPVPSTDPRDRSDNSQAFDEAVNSEGTTFNDRTGKSRLTIKGMEQVFDGGQPAIDAYYNAVEEADRAAAQVPLASAEADRAEAAADTATVSANAYEDVSSGLSAVADGEQFQVVIAGEIIRYRRDDASTATEVARYPSSGRVDDIEQSAILAASGVWGVMNGWGVDDDGVPVPSPMRFASPAREIHWWDALIQRSLFQDIAGRMPVTAPGQRVGLIKDVTGNGWELSAPTDSRRGTYKIDNRGVPYIEFTEDQVLLSLSDKSYSWPSALVVCAQGTGWFGLWEGVSSLGFRVDNEDSNFRNFTKISNSNTGNIAATTALASVSNDLPYVHSGRALTDSVTASLNGAPEISSAGSVSLAIESNIRFAIGNTSAQGTKKNRFYGGCYVIGEIEEKDTKGLASFFKVRSGVRALEQFEYDVFMCGGQSNCSGQGDHLTSAQVPFGAATEYQQGGVFKPLKDPTRHYAAGVAGNVSDTGSAWPAFAAKYFELTGRRALIVGGGASALGIGIWASSPIYRESMVDRYLEAKELIESRGGKINSVSMCYLGGETEALGSPTKETIKTNMMAIISAVRVRAEIPNMPAYLFSVDRNTDPGNDAGFAVVRDALGETAAENANVHLVMPYQDFVGQGKLVDSIHWNQVALNEAGEIAATNVASIVSP